VGVGKLHFWDSEKRGGGGCLTPYEVSARDRDVSSS